MRYLLLAVALTVIAGCASVAAGDKPRVFYDRKYNIYYQLRSDSADSKAPRSLPYYDRKYNTYLPLRGDAGGRS